MRSKRFSFSENTGLIAMLLVAFSSIVLAFHNKLSFYIHPRYIVSTVVLSIVAICLGMWSVKTSQQNSKIIKHKNIMVLLLLFLMFVIPVTSLSSRLAINRGGANTVSLNATTDLLKVGRDTEKLSLQDWASLLSQTAQRDRFVGKKASISGFIIPGDSRTFYLSRFVLTCCAVDARPTSVAVYYEGWERVVAVDEWALVEGNIDVVDETLVVRANSIQKIDKPKNPYAN